MSAKYGVLEQTQGLHLPAKFHLNVSIVSASGGQKTTIFGKFGHFGSSCMDPLLLMRAKFGVLLQTHGLRLHAKFRVDRCILSPSGGKKNNFCHILPYFGLRHLVVLPIGSSLRKLNTFGRSCTDPLLPMSAKYGVLEHTQGLHLPAKFHLNVSIVSASGGQKPQFWQILTFW